MHRRLFQLWILNESYALAREVRETKLRSLVHFGIVSGLVITLSWRFQKTAWDPLKSAGTNVDHWSIFVSFLNWWAHCTGACKKLHEANWSAREWTQIIGPFWYRFWLGDHIVLALPKNCMRSTEERGNKRRSLVHFCVVSELVSTLYWRLQKTTRGQLKCAGMNADHWSILVSFLAWWSHCDDFWQLNIVP